MKQFPISEFFKYKQEPIYILASKITYKEFFDKYGLKYEIWEEDGLGQLVGAAIKLGNFEYFLKSAYDYARPYTEIAFYVKAGCKKTGEAIKNLIKLLDLHSSEIEEISSYYLNYKWQIIQVPIDGPEVVIRNFEDIEQAKSTLDYTLKKYNDKFYINEIETI